MSRLNRSGPYTGRSEGVGEPGGGACSLSRCQRLVPEGHTGDRRRLPGQLGWPSNCIKRLQFPGLCLTLPEDAWRCVGTGRREERLDPGGSLSSSDGTLLMHSSSTPSMVYFRPRHVIQPMHQASTIPSPCSNVSRRLLFPETCLPEQGKTLACCSEAKGVHETGVQHPQSSPTKVPHTG